MHSKMEVIIVLGGWFVQEPDGNWRTMNFNEIDGEGLMSGDRVRVVAASFLSKKDPGLKIIVSGSKGRLNQTNCPTLAAVLKRELVELGVDPRNIIEENKSTGTFGQLKESLEMVRKLKFSEVGIISNNYHLPRIEEMLRYIPNLNCQIRLISGEEIAIKNDPEFWTQEVRDAYASKAMKKRMALEQKGVQDIKDGKYKFN